MEKKKKIEVYDRKIVYAGDVVELIEYKRPIISGYQNKIEKQQREQTQEVKKENFDRSMRRTRKKIMDYINCNFDDRSSFLTLTFKENMRDLELANYQWKLFKQRLERKYKQKLKYCGVIEFQNGDTIYLGSDGKTHKGTGRKAIHYHICLFDIDFLPHNELYAMWNEVTQGGVNIKKIKNVDNVGAYLVGYMGKGDQDFFDNEYKGKKRYLASFSNLKKPQVMKLDSEVPTEKADFEIIKNTLQKYKTYYYESKEFILKTDEKEYTDMETGEIKKELQEVTQQITYTQFNLNINKKYREELDLFKRTI